MDGTFIVSDVYCLNGVDGTFIVGLDKVDGTFIVTDRLGKRRPRQDDGHQGASPKLPEKYAHHTRPTLVFWAVHDKHLPLPQAEHLYQAISGSHLRVISVGWQWMELSLPLPVADAITRFCLQPIELGKSLR